MLGHDHDAILDKDSALRQKRSAVSGTIIDNNNLRIGAKEDYMNGFDQLYKLPFHVESEVSTELDKMASAGELLLLRRWTEAEDKLEN
jgi:hypothetical protein